MKDKSGLELLKSAKRVLPPQMVEIGGTNETADSMWTTKWKGKRLPSGEFCLEFPTLQSLFNQGIPDNLFEQKKVTFHLERPANTSAQ
ncbi:hypothetical protein ACFOSW_12470 [Paenibacillus sp. GCM10012303]